MSVDPFTYHPLTPLIFPLSESASPADATFFTSSQTQVSYVTPRLAEVFCLKDREFQLLSMQAITCWDVKQTYGNVLFHHSYNKTIFTLILLITQNENIKKIIKSVVLIPYLTVPHRQILILYLDSGHFTPFTQLVVCNQPLRG